MFFVIVLAVCGANLVSAADPIRLWAGAVLGALGEADHDIPTITPYLPPDFGVLCYAVISMEDGVTHGGSKTNLLGKDPDSKLVELLSNEKQVTKNTPPCFAWSTQEDKAVLVTNSLRFVAAL